MGEIGVVILTEGVTQWSEACREYLARFASELEEVVHIPRSADVGSVVNLIRSPFVAFLDSRTAVSPGWAGRLIRALDSSKAGIVGPLCNGATGPQRRAADYQDIEGYLAFTKRIAEAYDGQTQAVEVLDGCCVLTRRERLISYDSRMRIGDVVAAMRADGHPAVIALDAYVHSFADYYERARPDVERLVPLCAKMVLDVGCGTGILGAHLKQRGVDRVIGVELDPDAAATAEYVLDRVHVGDIEGLDLPYEANTFDCIIFADVLEHLRDPWGLLKRLVPLLKAGGRVVVSLPNVRHWSVVRGLLQGEWAYLPAGLLDRGHLRFFTLQSGRTLLETAGLVIREIHALRSGPLPDLTPLVDAARSLAIDCSTLAEEAEVVQFLFVAERPG